MKNVLFKQQLRNPIIISSILGLLVFYIGSCKPDSRESSQKDIPDSVLQETGSALYPQKDTAGQRPATADVWTLVLQDRFQEACEQADAEYQQTGEVFPLRNKVSALLLLKQYPEALALSARVIKQDGGDVEIDFITMGIAHWAMGNQKQAIQAWRSAENCTYTDAAGGMQLQIILYFAGLRTEDENLSARSLQKIKKLAGEDAAVNWPGALGPYILNQIGAEEVQAAVSTVSVLKERELCQKSFVDGIKELEHNNKKGYTHALQACISYRPHSYLEPLHHLAMAELNNESVPQ
jgi:tetratricopeptide (TPR) repeat protein